MNVTGELEGIEAVFLVHQEVRPGPMGSRDLESELALTLLPDEPIPFGAVGTYKAMVSGAGGSDSGDVIMGSRSGSTGEVEVLQFNQDLVHLKVRGEYCYFSNYDHMKQTCRKVENFSGEIIKPFGWAYESSQIFSSLDTPGMAEYREWLSEGLSEMFPGQMKPEKADGSATPGGPSPTPGSSIGGSVSNCICTCEELNRLERIGEEWEVEAEAREKAGEFAGFPPPELMQILSCMGSCGQQWDACDGD
jgi:hypothetical protein